MKIALKFTPRHLAAGVAGVLVAAAVVAVPVMAATTSPTTSSAGPTTSASCLSARIAARVTPSVTTLQALGDCAVGQRLSTLGRLQATVDGTAALTADHHTALDTLIGDAKTGLATLKAKIDADTTVPSLHTDLRQVSAGFRVDRLVVRQVSLVRGDDLVAAQADRLTADAGQIQAAITAGQNAHKNEAAAATRLSAMQADIAAAQAQLSGQAGLVLALTPAQWNAGTAAPTLNADRSAIDAARGDLASAMRAENSAVAALK